MLGYSGADCTVPVCDAVSCGPDPNKCVAPNQCVCAKLYTQVKKLEIGLYFEIPKMNIVWKTF